MAASDHNLSIEWLERLSSLTWQGTSTRRGAMKVRKPRKIMSCVPIFQGRKSECSVVRYDRKECLAYSHVLLCSGIAVIYALRNKNTASSLPQIIVLG